MLFGAFVVEREPMQWAQLPDAFWAWARSAGGVAALMLLFLTLQALKQSQHEKRKEAGPLLLGLSLFFLSPFALFLWLMLTLKKRWQPAERALLLPYLYLGSALSLCFYDAYFLVRMFGGSAAAPATPPAALNLAAPLTGAAAAVPGGGIREFLLTAGGLCAIVVALLPILHAAWTRMRWGRIWALARLSLKEAVRSRVVLVFSLLALVFLFADWFVDTSKPENQVRNYVTVVYWSMTPLFLLVASILGAFSIPNDIKNQSIHTIVTKPVEKLEIVLGRFVGFAMLLSIGLICVTALSYLYILRGVDPEAARESMRARVPIVGSLYFSGLDGVKKEKWDNPGREYDYGRSYITGPHGGGAKHVRNFAIYSFDTLPASLGEDGPVPVEFTFDIFRLHKGKESEPIRCVFTFVDGSKELAQIEKIRQEVALKADNHKARLGGAWTRDEGERYELELLEQYAFWSPPPEKVRDYHTESIEVPGELFKKLRQVHRPGQGPILKVVIEVSSESKSQMVGVARRDLYLLMKENPFGMNFVKGVIGMWFSYLTVLGVAIACSTYLSGVISWFATLFLYGTGVFNEYVQSLAAGSAFGGGPAEASFRLYERRPITMPADDAPLAGVITRIDDFYRWWLQMVLNIIPDVNRYDLISYVANGFDIPWGQVLLLDNFIYLVGYLVPWFVLAFYLLKFREIANPT